MLEAKPRNVAAWARVRAWGRRKKWCRPVAAAVAAAVVTAGTTGTAGSADLAARSLHWLDQRARKTAELCEEYTAKKIEGCTFNSKTVASTTLLVPARIVAHHPSGGMHVQRREIVVCFAEGGCDGNLLHQPFGNHDHVNHDGTDAIRTPTESTGGFVERFFQNLV